MEGDAAQDSLRKEAAPATDNRGDGQPHDTPKSTDGLVLGMAIGMVAGILIGFVLHQMPIWIVVGILLGGFIGFLLDSRNDRRRKESVAGEKRHRALACFQKACFRYGIMSIKKIGSAVKGYIVF